MQKKKETVWTWSNHTILRTVVQPYGFENRDRFSWFEKFPTTLCLCTPKSKNLNNKKRTNIPIQLQQKQKQDKKVMMRKREWKVEKNWRSTSTGLKTQIERITKRKTKHKLIKVKIKMKRNSKVRRVEIEELETRSPVHEIEAKKEVGCRWGYFLKCHVSLFHWLIYFQIFFPF